jgi:cell wall-associated NlpC family hydrolase
MHRSARSPYRALVAIVVACVGTLLTVVPPARAESANDKRAEAKQIAERLAELKEEQMDLGATYERANYERHLADQKATEAQAQADKTSAELDIRRQELRNFAVSAYQGGNEAPTAAALLAEEANSGAVKRFYLETTTGDRGDLIDALKSAQRAAEDDVERLNAARAEAESHVAEIESARAASAKATEKQDELNARVQGELASLVAEEAAAYAARNPASSSITAAAPAGSPAPAAPSQAPAPRSAPAPAPQPPAPAPPPSGSKASGAISAALSKVGSGYVWGAAGPSTFDCSGLMLWAYAQVGVSLPHYSGAQYSTTTRISAGQLQPGDLVFWGPGGSEHVALYMGGNQIVHAFSSAARVQVTALAGWWKSPSGYGRLNY